MAILAFTHPVFAPAMRIVSNITNANPAVVTTTFAHNYISGNIVRIDMPTNPYNLANFGMDQINGQFAPIVVTGPTTFTIAIDTTLYTPFSTPSFTFNYPQVVPIAELSSQLTAAVQNVLPYMS